MRKRFTSKQPLFSQDEVAEDASALSVAVAEVDPNDIDRRMKWGYTPLIQAAVDGDYAECKRLKDAGADIALKDNGGKTACQKAEARGFDTIVELLS
jgi:ankyrin repeat protein